MFCKLTFNFFHASFISEMQAQDASTSETPVDSQPQDDPTMSYIPLDMLVNPWTLPADQQPRVYALSYLQSDDGCMQVWYNVYVFMLLQTNVESDVGFLARVWIPARCAS